MLAKTPLSEEKGKGIFDSIDMFGPLLVARSIEDASMHLLLTNSTDQLSFMLSKTEPAIFKMPECSTVHLGDYFIADDKFLVVEPCPGKLLTIQSSFKKTNDEDSWMAYFAKHALKVTMTAGLLGTGAW